MKPRWGLNIFPIWWSTQKIVAGARRPVAGLPNYIPERDGTLAGLLLLEIDGLQQSAILNSWSTTWKRNLAAIITSVDYSMDAKKGGFKQTQG